MSTTGGSEEVTTSSSRRRIRTVESIMRAKRFLASARATWADFVRRHMPNEAQHLFALTLLTGVVCGFAAVAFHLTIQAFERLMIDRAMSAPGNAWIVWTLISPTLGGLCAGALLTWVVPGARGSGIPQVKQAFAVEGGRVAFRDALGKFFVGALNIGSGGSLGREGPTVQICAGATSLLARLTLFRAKNMRRLTPVGVAAGIAAAFNAPIAAVTFTIEEVVGNLDQAVLSGVVIAAAVAAVIERGILGVNPVIEVDRSFALDHASSLALYTVLGVAAAFTSVAFTDGLLATRAWFRRLRLVPTWMHPGVGGLVTGALAIAALRFFDTRGVNGGGYAVLGQALAGQLGLQVLLFLCIVKMIATVFSYSSGGAGGIFAPALFVGAMLGGVVGHLDVVVLDHDTRELGAFALVGMGAVFAGVIRAPITSVLIIFEMTGGYGLVLPLMLANMTSYVIARKLRPLPIYEALLAQDGITLPHGGPPSAPQAFDRLSVADAMTSHVVTVHPDESIRDTVAAIAGQTFSTLPVVDAHGGVLGVVATSRLFEVSALPDAPVATLMRPGAVVGKDAPLLEAIARMNDLGARQLLVVDRGSEHRLVGIVALSDLVRAHAKAVPPTAIQPSGARRAIVHTELRAQHLMTAAVVVPGTTRVVDLVTAMRAQPDKALIVHDASGGYSVVLSQDLNQLGRDEELQKMLIASDVVRPVRPVEETADLTALVHAMDGATTEAVVVLDAKTNDPLGIITKSTLAAVFFDWYASDMTNNKAAEPPR